MGEGDFAVLVPEADAEHARLTAQRLARSLRLPVEVADLRLDASAAVGIAHYPGHGADADPSTSAAPTAFPTAR